MLDHANKANIIKSLAFYGLTIISDQCVTGPKGMLLASAKPDEQCISALKQR
ncbi:hypothetical protein [Enterobacter mori]|uniref:hypothetical protein n=1 Tax=Enterobacter mori TaxID=539813 RepID=UPI003016F645